MLYPIISVLLVSAVSLIGVFAVSLKTELLRKYIFILVSLAIGTLLGDSFIHIIPEAVAALNSKLVGILIIAGVLLFLSLEKILFWHHHHGMEKEGCGHIHPVGPLILMSDSLHNLLDGFIIGAAYLINLEIGIATTIAIIMHEIPQEITDFSILIHSGYSKNKALLMNFVSAVMAVVGAALALLLNGQAGFIISWSLPIAAGGFIYIALSDLVPELHKKSSSAGNSLLQLFIILIGLALMFALTIFE